MNNIETILLEKIRFEYGMIIPEDILGSLTVEEIIDFETNGLKVFFRIFILGRKIKEETKESIILYPDWWNHFKACHFPKWLKRRFPIKFKYEPVTILHYHLCPHTGIDLRNDDRFRHISFLQGDESEIDKHPNWTNAFTKIVKDNLKGK